MKIYTRRGDDGTTGLLYGGRIGKDAAVIEATGAVDEAQAALGMARAEAPGGSEVGELLVGLERDLYVLMAELTTLPENRHKLAPGASLVTPEMVGALEEKIDSLTGRFPPITEFVVPGQNRLSAALDLARTAVRRAERAAVGAAVPDSLAGSYLNRLSDLVWTMARWQEHGESLAARSGARTKDRGRESMAGVRFEAAAEVPVGVEVLGVPVFSDLSVPPGAGADVDPALLRRFGFEGKAGQAQLVGSTNGGSEGGGSAGGGSGSGGSGSGTSVVAIGVGDASDVDRDVIRRAGAALARAAGRATTIATTLPAVGSDDGLAQAAVEGIGLAAYRFAGNRKKPPAVHLELVTMVGASEDEVRAGRVAVEATTRTRDWVNEPPRRLTPTRLGELAAELAEAPGLSVEVWDEDRIAAERLGGLAGVASGSVEPARLIRLTYDPPGAGADVATIALVGKGITFDSGGLSLKTPTGMMTMKDDMGGAGAVLSATAGAAALGLGVRVVAWAAATENMPSGTAIHPGDVLVARNGTTIEVLNTDAEGRLVLADALSLAAEEKPAAIVDVATLTGAQIAALGERVGAVMSNDDALADRVIAAGERAGEPFWRLPLVKAYRSKLDSEVADVKNVASGGGAGSIIAGLFLAEFVDGLPWAHLDIAGPAWSDSDEGWLAKGGTGWATRTLLQLLAGWAV